MDTLGSKSNRKPKSKLAPETMEELRQLAELAKRDPAIMQQITARQTSDAMFRVLSLEEDEFNQLEELTQEEYPAMETNYFDQLAAATSSPLNFKPCPFCRSETRHILKHLDEKHSVFCVSCEAIGPKKPTQEEAANAWNQPPRK